MKLPPICPSMQEGGASDPIEIGLTIMPPPWPTMMPEAALAWLRERAHEWVSLVGDGCDPAGAGGEAATPSDREAFGVLGIDVSSMISGCAESIATGRPLRIESCEQPDTCDLRRRIVAWKPTHSTGDFEQLYEQLAALAE